MSFESFEINTIVVIANVKIPVVEGFESETLARQVNEEIKIEMITHIEEGRTRAKEYREAVIEIGGKDKDFIPIRIEIYYNFESLASLYAKTYYYIVDLEENKLLCLEDFLESNYENIVNQEISKKIEKDSK